MPIYEYHCNSCRKNISLLLITSEDFSDIRCPHCRGTDLKRLLSRFSHPKSEEERLEKLASDPSLYDIDENDPRSIQKGLKKIGKELGLDEEEDWEGMADELLEQEVQDNEEESETE
ncbi:MAG: zinc ribbon domain-containing protein [Candidatus Aenigmatarchaeota archaeon]